MWTQHEWITVDFGELQKKLTPIGEKASVFSEIILDIGQLLTPFNRRRLLLIERDNLSGESIGIDLDEDNFISERMEATDRIESSQLIVV